MFFRNARQIFKATLWQHQAATSRSKIRMQHRCMHRHSFPFMFARLVYVASYAQGIETFKY